MCLHICGPATMVQIHAQSSGRARNYLALYQLCTKKLLEVNPTIEKELQEGVVNAITNVSKYQKVAETRVKENPKNFMEIFQTLDFEFLQQKFNES